MERVEDRAQSSPEGAAEDLHPIPRSEVAAGEVYHPASASPTTVEAEEAGDHSRNFALQSPRTCSASGWAAAAEGEVSRSGCSS